jgi:hypothetical protein
LIRYSLNYVAWKDRKALAMTADDSVLAYPPKVRHHGVEGSGPPIHHPV